MAPTSKISSAHQKLAVNFATAISAAVRNGSVLCISLYSFSTCGTTTSSIKSITPMITARTMAGYVIAPRILLTMAASFSCWEATRLSAWSSVPEASPAVTSER